MFDKTLTVKLKGPHGTIEMALTQDMLNYFTTNRRVTDVVEAAVQAYKEMAKANEVA